MAEVNKLVKGDYYDSGRYPVGENGAHKCPVCKQHVFEEAGSFDICEVCNWEDDNIQENDPNYEGGANRMSLNQAIEYWQVYKKPIP